MDNQRKLHFVMDLLNEIVLRRGQDASTDRIGEGLATAVGNLVLAYSRMSVEGQADGDQPDDGNDDEPHGSRDTFVPRSALRRSKRVPFVPKSDGPDGERFNPLQD